MTTGLYNCTVVWREDNWNGSLCNLTRGKLYEVGANGLFKDDIGHPREASRFLSSDLAQDLPERKPKCLYNCNVIWRKENWNSSLYHLTENKIYEVRANGYFKDDTGSDRNSQFFLSFDRARGLPDTAPEDSVKSDGGSSSYYSISLPPEVLARIAETGCIEVKDIVKHGFDNDFDAGNIIKATKRIMDTKAGRGKSGTDIKYDSNKIKFFAEEIKE